MRGMRRPTMRMRQRSLVVVLLAAALPWAGHARAPEAGPGAPPDSEAVGRRGSNRTVLPVNQVVTPAGTQVDLPGLRYALSGWRQSFLQRGATARISNI